jgi:phytanoyl-CoA hydroxylase
VPELSQSQHRSFRDLGHVVVNDLVDQKTASNLRRAFERQTQTWADDVGTSVSDYLAVISQWTNVWEHNAIFRQQLYDKNAAAIAAELIGCERVRVFHDHLIAKPPQGGSTIPWHRDLANWPVAEPRAVSCWLAMDDAPSQSGAMQFMPGGHKEEITQSIDFLNEAQDWGEREKDVVSVPVHAGDAIFHHCLSWHSSPPNRTDAWRRAYITIYLDAECTFDPNRAGWHPVCNRVTVPPGQIFNSDAFPILGGRRSQP